MHRLISRVALSGVALALTSGLINSPSARAFPPFKDKEGKPCSFCHLSPSGGKRNYRGLFYKAHGLSFAEFDDVAEAKKAGVDVAADPDPSVKPKSWTAPAPAPTAPEPVKPAESAPEATKGPTVAELKKKVATAEAAMKKSPKNVKAKNAYAQALAELGHGTMLDASLPPAKRYPDALRILRQAAKVDPKNKLALEDIKQIEDAYKSMGRPIPK